jgi:hypothetical protein
VLWISFGRSTVFKTVRRRCEIPYTCPDDNAGAHLLDADVTVQTLGHRIRRAQCALLMIGLEGWRRSLESRWFAGMQRAVRGVGTDLTGRTSTHRLG